MNIDRDNIRPHGAYIHLDPELRESEIANALGLGTRDQTPPLENPETWVPSTPIRVRVPFGFVPTSTPSPTRNSMATRSASDPPSPSKSGHRLSQAQRERKPEVKCIVEARGLRDDFYCTQIAAPQGPTSRTSLRNDDSAPTGDCAHNQYVAVALGPQVRLWTSQLGPEKIHLPRCYTYVTCLAARETGEWLAVGNADGEVHVYDVIAQALIARLMLPKVPHNHSFANVTSFRHPEELRVPTCILWLDSHTIAVGDSFGSLHRIWVNGIDQTYRRLMIGETITCHSELICSIAMDCSRRVIAVGANDNSVSLWEMEPGPSLRWYQSIPHPSAIRALTFCPYLPRLLATGSGRHDRTLRIYNIQTDQLIVSISTPAQIVGIIWLNRWEVFVALGHSRKKVQHPGSDVKEPYAGLGLVYSLPSGKCVGNIDGAGRALASVKVDNTVCIATSRDRLIFFDWKPDEIDPCSSCELLSPLSRARSPTASPRLR